MRNRAFPNDRNKKGARNDYAQGRQDNTRFQSSNSATGQHSNSKDNKLENKYMLGDFITQDITRQRSVNQAKALEPETSFPNSKQYPNKTFSREYKPAVDKRTPKIEPQNLVTMMEQVKIFGYDVKDDRNNFVAANSGLKPGMEVMAKYWEDKQVINHLTFHLFMCVHLL